MHIDPFTILVFNIMACFLMSAGLFGVSQSHFRGLKGIRHWAIALLLFGIGWMFIILNGFLPKFFTQVLGSTLLSLGLAFYFHALVAFKEENVPVKWAYWVFAFCFIGNVYFVHIHFDLNAKIVVTALGATILLFANSILLFRKQQRVCPFSHRLTGSIFAVAGTVILVRAFYYLFWHTQAEQTLLHTNIIQSVSYLTITITIVGTSFGFSLMCNDKYVAEKEQAQLARQEALDHLQKIASRVPGMVYQFKLSAEGYFSIPYSNDGVYDIFRLSAAQVREDATPVFNRIHPDDYEYFKATIYESAYNLTLWLCEFRVRFEDGNVRWSEGNAAPQRKPDGSTLWHGFITDITARRENEERLRILSVAVEQSPASIMITNATAKLIYVNPRFTEVTGYHAEEVMGKNPRVLQSGLTSAAVYAQLWETLRQGKIWRSELINQRKNGEMYWEETHITPVHNSQGITTHYVGIKLDITERKQAEQAILEAKEAAIVANQTKSEFLANMSHEIRTPMNAILGFTSILNGLITDSTQRYYLDAIERSGKTLLRLINDILDLSKIEAGKFSLQYTPVSIRALLDDVSMVFSQKSQDKNLEFSVLLDENLPDTLLLDEIRLRQVLLNLISNAVKFTEQGFIHACVTMRPVTSDNQLDLIIHITDSGMGIACDQLEAIFSSFTQQKHQNAGYGGTGLGLTICKRLIEMMGGTINVSSAVGQGSCFSIELPNIEICSLAEPQTQQENLVPKAVHFQPATVLVVDDSEINRLVIKAYLDDYPELELIEAENGEQVLELIEQYDFALILMDKIMPGEDGDSVCQKIKAMPSHADIPIIMISAAVLTAQEAEQPHFYDLHLNKPVNKADLLVALQAFLPIAESEEITSEPVTAQMPENVITEAVDPEKRQELVELLRCRYQVPITRFADSGAFKVNALIDLAEQLLELAEQYHCSALFDWASTLKNQAQLFDITNLAKTLKSFVELLKQLEAES